MRIRLLPPPISEKYIRSSGEQTMSRLFPRL
nr:MAG TPA: hypothetical protein [Caudoviricetes sp.]